MNGKTEIKDYRIEFDGDEPVDVNDLQAAMIIKEVLYALDVDKKVSVEQFVKYTFEASKGGIDVEFVGEEPDYWYAEADIRGKVVEVGMGDHRMRIPLATILFWFSKEEKEDMR